MQQRVERCARRSSTTFPGSRRGEVVLFFGVLFDVLALIALVVWGLLR